MAVAEVETKTKTEAVEAEEEAAEGEVVEEAQVEVGRRQWWRRGKGGGGRGQPARLQRGQLLGAKAVLGGDQPAHVRHEVDDGRRRRRRRLLARRLLARHPPPHQSRLARVRAEHDPLEGRLLRLNRRMQADRPHLVHGRAPAQHVRQLLPPLRALAQRLRRAHLVVALLGGGEAAQPQRKLLVLERRQPRGVPIDVRLDVPRRRGAGRGVRLHELDLYPDEREQQHRQAPLRTEGAPLPLLPQRLQLGGQLLSQALLPRQ